MKRSLLCLLSSLVVWSSPSSGAPGEADWRKVDELIEKQEPKSAIAALAPLEAAALAEKAWPEAARAMAMRILIESALEQDKPEGRIVRMEAALAGAPQEMLPVLQTLSANWFYEYFQENKWAIMQRTAGGAGKDVAAWDLKRLLAETDARFQKALSAAPVLRQTPIAKWDGLLPAGKLPDLYQPTLYDFVAREALAFYTMAEQAGAAEQNAFEFDEKSAALGTLEEFLAWKPGQGNSSKLQAIRLYQELLTFHKDDTDPGARSLLDIERLEWAGETATGEGAAARARQQIGAIAQKVATHEVSLRAKSQVAAGLMHEHKHVEARKLLQEAVAAFDKSVFAPRARNLVKQIEGRELSAGTELMWNAAQPEISITSRNLKKAFFRLYLVSDKPDPAKIMSEWEDVDEEKVQRLIKAKPARSWEADLPGPDDFMEHRHKVPAPVDLKSGFYFLAISGNAEFGEKDNVVSGTRVWVSPLALVSRTRHTAGGMVVDGWVLDAVSGEPVSGADVSMWIENTRDEKTKKAGSAKTGTDGFVSFQPKSPGQVILFASRGGHTALSAGNAGIGRDPFSNPGEKKTADERTTTFFFTDRGIYRPGQTIQIKGIHVFHDTDKNDYRALPNVKRRVVLKDSNEREIAAIDGVTNAYGSFSGSFTAPRGLTGSFMIDDGRGSLWINIEEYKRPEFRVEIDPPAASPKLGGEVAVKVKAIAYAGAAVDGATVKWNVRREAQWPEWATGMQWPSPRPGAQEMAQGESKTGADGSLEIKFTALPDKAIDEKSEPWFRYRISVDITDTAGETRSSERTVIAGYAALKAGLKSDDWQTIAAPVEFTVTTTTLDDQPEEAEGTLTVHRLVQPDKVHRHSLDDGFVGFSNDSDFRIPAKEPEKDLSNPEDWATGEVVQRDNFKSADKGTAKVAVKLAAGAYRAVLETKDRFGKKVTAQHTLVVADPGADKFPVRLPVWANTRALVLQPGDEFSGLWGSGYDKARAFIEVEHRGKMVQRLWTDPARTQQGLTFKVMEEHRGGFTVHFTQMRENRLYSSSVHIDVPWTSKELSMKWEHLTSKLEPGAKETWTLTVEGAAKEKLDAELAAVLYDASLDAFSSHQWLQRFTCFYQDQGSEDVEYAGGDEMMDFEEVGGEWNQEWEEENEARRHWPWIRGNGMGNRGFQRAARSGAVLGAVAGGVIGHNEVTRGLRFGSDNTSKNAIDALIAGGTTKTGAVPMAAPVAAEADYSAGAPFASGRGDPFAAVGGSSKAKVEAAPVDLSKVSARRNLQETAFFFPHLKTEENGAVKITFTMPEAVTTWKFLGFAHDRELRSGSLEGQTVTAKDLMVQPNPPRFLREGDAVEFTVKITNQSASPQEGTARLNFSDAATLASADTAVGNQKPEQPYSVPAKESRTLSWRITIPDGQGFLSWKAVAGNDKLTDGEEGWLPVLSRRIPVTESMPLPVRDAGTKEFTLKKLADSAGSETLRHQSLTVQMVSQPAWYAVMALPYLMEYPHECSEQTFNRLYANVLARHIAKTDPKIRRVFDVWKEVQPDAMKSPLEKNPELASLMIEETPWLREAKAESQRNLGVLFDDNRLDSETERLINSLGEMQMEDGAWPWFPGGPSSDFITLYIVSGFGRLHHLGVTVNLTPALKAMDRLDAWLAREYQEVMKRKTKDKDGDTFHSTHALYLYGRSFFLKERPVPSEQKEALDYFLDQARKHWTGVPRMSQAHAALGLLRFGDKKTPATILNSIKERSTSSEELGLYWADEPARWAWNQAPVETQALMIEAFRDIAKDEKSVDDCQVWLLKQKQTQAWPTTKATADAVYALLLGGTSKLSSDALVSVSLGGKEVKAEKAEAGTGFYEHRFAAGEINAAMGAIKLEKKDKGVAWGSVHWQYMEDMSKVTPHEGTPLKVTKALFTKVNTPAGPELRPVTGKVKVGDELVVRIEIRTDRDMEFIHLKDQRPSSVEPVNVLSEYKWQDGLGYYESTRDTASHFFIDSLAKGTYVFEYSARVQLRGKCQTGIAELQCMYAPEFNSHSASTVLEVE